MPPRCARRILVVEDDADVRAFLADALALEGHHVAAADNGVAALAVVAAEPLDLVLLDLRMPVLDGPGFARELEARGVAIPILVIAAGEDIRARGEEIGAAGWLAKPFGLVDLLAKVERLRPDA